MVAALRRTTELALVIAGTADRVAGWDFDLVQSVGVAVHEVLESDHALMVPGPLASLARVLGEVITVVERFLDEVVWPAG